MKKPEKESERPAIGSLDGLVYQVVLLLLSIRQRASRYQSMNLVKQLTKTRRGGIMSCDTLTIQQFNSFGSSELLKTACF